MTETKTEIPAATLAAATECILTRGGFNRHDYQDVYIPTHSRYVAAAKEATAILEAAGVAELLARIAVLETEIAEYQQEEETRRRIARDDLPGSE